MRNAQLPAGVVSPAPPLLDGDAVPGRAPRDRPGPAHVPATLPGKPVSLPTTGFAADPQHHARGGARRRPASPVRLELNGKRFDDPVGPNDERPQAGTVEEWRFVNLSADTHPMHMHLTPFQVVDRWAFDVAAYTADAEAAHEAGRSRTPTRWTRSTSRA